MPQQPWIKQLFQWIRHALGFKSDAPQPRRAIEEYYGDAAALFRLHDPSIPGCVDLWRVDRHDASGKFFICLINVAQLHEEIGKQGSSSGDRLGAWFRGLGDSLEIQLEAQSGIMATHYWICGWIQSKRKIDSKGRIYQGTSISDVALIACDLQGVGGQFTGDRYALRFARKIAFRLANDIDSKDAPLKFNTWEEIIRLIDWKEWLEGYCHAPGGIHPEHVLQPKKSKLRKR